MPVENKVSFWVSSVFFFFLLMVNATVEAQDIPKLINKLAEETADEAGNELFAIGGPALPYLLDALSSSDQKIRRDAIIIFFGILSFNPQAMMETSKAPDRIPRMIQILIGGLSDQDSDVRENVSFAIASVGSLAPIDMFEEKITPLLLKALRDESEKVRVGIANSIVTLPDNFTIPIKLLIEVLADENAEVRERITWAIKEQIPFSKEQSCPDCVSVIPSLQKLLNDSDRKVRHTAAMTLVAINSDAHEAIPVLIDAVSLELQQEYSLGLALKSLQSMEQNGSTSFTLMLKEFLISENKDIRRAAEQAIKLIEAQR